MLETFIKKNSLRNLTRFHGWLFELDGDPKIFHNIFFVENYYMNYKFFQVLQSALLKSETKIFSKMMQVT